MRFKAERTALSKALARVVGVAPRKAQLPILTSVLVEASAHRVTLTCTNLDIVVRTSFAADVAEGGAACVDARRLKDVVGMMPGTDVDVASSGAHLVDVVSGAAKFKLIGSLNTEFPKLPEQAVSLEGRTATCFPKDVLAEMLAKTLYSVSDDETRYVLCGVHISATGDEVTTASTDGHRLSRCTRNVKGGAKGFPANVIVPRAGCAALARLCQEDADLPVRVCCTTTHLVADLDDTCIAVRLIDGNFPDIKQVIPATSAHTIKVAKHFLSDALKRMRLVAGNSGAVKATLSTGEVVLTSSSPDAGEATETISASGECKKTQIGINTTYLGEAVAACSGDVIELRCNDELSPMSVAAPDDNRDLFIIMPMRV